jgi:predicted lipid-binding transport protein (Tim44 family)
VGEFLQGARGAYEMILMGFERGDLAPIKPFLAPEVYEAFSDVVSDRERQGLSIEAEFAGVREVALVEAEFDQESRLAEITVKFIGELTSVVRDRSGTVIEDHSGKPRRQRDDWTFARKMGSNDPNWQLVATGG